MISKGQAPNKVTFVALVSVCADEAVLTQGSLIHEHIVSCNLQLDVEIGNSLVNMYGRCGSLEDALEVFYTMPEHNLVSWSSLIMLCTQHDIEEEALRLFAQMLGIFPVCASEATLAQGRDIHHCLVSNGFDADTVIETALLSMYSKCGSMKDSQRIFELLEVRNVISWNSLIAAHAYHGHGVRAITCFYHMVGQHLRPDECTFYGLLSACSHTGLLEEAVWYFSSMVQSCLIVPTVEHFNCIVDLFGRAGQLELTDGALNMMELQPSSASWMTMLSASRLHPDMTRRGDAIAQVLDLIPRNVNPPLLLFSTPRPWKANPDL